MTIEDIVGDNPKRSFFRDALNHASTFACEYCESAAVQRKDNKQIAIIRNKYEMQRHNVTGQITSLINSPASSASATERKKKLETLNKILLDLDTDEKKELKKIGGNKLCWPATTMNGNLRTIENITHIVNSIEDDVPMSKEDCKGFRGKSVLLSQPNFHFINNISTEYMHSTCLGVVKRITELTFKVGEHRQRVTKRKLSDPKHFNMSIRLIKLPGECSRRCRNLDFSVLKATEFRNLILFFFPIVLDCIGNEHNVEKNVWLDLAYMIRTCIVTNEEFDFISNELIVRVCIHFYRNYEKIYGVSNCTYSVHVVGSHLLQMRGTSPLNSRSAFKYESFYAEMKNLFCPGTPSTTKQILRNCLMKRQLENHACVKKIKYQIPPRKETRENNSSIYVLNGNAHEMYNIKEKNPNKTFTCVKQGKFTAQFNDIMKKNWSDVGVYKLGPTCDKPIIIKECDIAGKVIKVNNYLITCPNHVLREQ